VDIDPHILSLTALLAAALGYALGSVPFGFLLTHLSGRGDIRAVGSGNTGATNVLRTGSRGLAALTLLCDVGKGALAVLIAHAWLDEPYGMIAGVAAVLGHDFPVWLRFRGGKGVATTLGVVLALAWPVGLFAVAAWLVTAVAFRYSSLAALVALSLVPPVMAWHEGFRPAVATCGLAVLTIILHRENIRRLASGDEPKIRLGRRD
jgi:acyl phosphate:glycerol-3-phosphate acyltransferase